MPVKRPQEYKGFALLSFGFRPFFLMASLYGGLSVLIWLPFLRGYLEAGTTFLPVDWHMHELFFGFITAVICGFLFTSIPNWTGRLPVQGLPLLSMVTLWLMGRGAIFFSAHIGWIGALVIDGAFLCTLWAAISIEILKGRNWRNLKILIPLSFLTGSNILFHLEAHYGGSAEYSKRIALAAIIAFILLIGGRIIPSFTRNWLVKFNPGRLPHPFALYEKITLVFSIVTLFGWFLFPNNHLVGLLFWAAAILLVGQLFRWAGNRALKAPLVLVLHSSYFFIPLGFMLMGGAILFPSAVSPVAGIHALGTGAAANMILSVMVRSTKGHTGRTLRMEFADYAIFGSILFSAITRIASALFPDQEFFLLEISVLLWVIAFLGFAAAYSGALLNPKVRPFS
ncbi:NnrS family protein [Sneathiella sp.]|jgi:uncharacterized protein involved in response to NO|uniref:NnrS family protein n=1 Tax=Sneathiella sp. TaxID=1964365 RepID=UPI0039E357E5